MKLNHFQILFGASKTVFAALSLTILLSLTACSSRSVATVASEGEAIEIIDVLRENEIISDKTEVGDERSKQYQILVDEDYLGGSDNYSAAFQILSDNCLPHRDPAPPQDNGVIPSIEVEKQRTQWQLKMNIIRQLRKLPGVTCVDVNFVFPQDQLTSINPYPATASVVILYKNQDVGFNEQQIKNLVATSVPNLQPEKVTVQMSYKPIRPIVKFNRRNLNKILLIGGAALFVILGSVLLIFFLRKRGGNSETSTALVELPEVIEDSETS